MPGTRPALLHAFSRTTTGKPGVPIAPAVPWNTKKKLAADNMPSQIAIRVREGIPRRMRRRKPTRSNPMCGHWLSISLALSRKNGGHIVRTISLRRAQMKIGMMNLVYSMKRLVQLIVRDAKTSFRAACVTNVVGHPLWHQTGEIKLERSVLAFSQRENQVAS